MEDVRIELFQFAAFAFPAHPGFLRLIVEPRPVEQVKRTAAPGARVALVELVHTRDQRMRNVVIGRHVLSRSEEHTSELQSLMRISYAVFCLKKKNKTQKTRSVLAHHNGNYYT